MAPPSAAHPDTESNIGSLANTAPENEEGAKAESRTQVQRSSIVKPKAHPSTDTETWRALAYIAPCKDKGDAIANEDGVEKKANQELLPKRYLES